MAVFNRLLEAAALAAVILALTSAHVCAGPVPRQARLTVADFEETAHGWSGGTIDPAVAHSGSASLRWDNHPANPRLICTDPPRDWSRFDFLEFWLCSAVANGAEMRLVIFSENPNTDGPDYWSKRIVVDWTGWRHFRIYLPGLYPARQPLGWDHVDQFFFTTTGWGCTPKPDTRLWIDDVALTNPLVRVSLAGWQRIDATSARLNLDVSAITDQPVDARVEPSYTPGLRFSVDPATVALAPTETRPVAVRIAWERSDELWQVMRQQITFLVHDRDSGEVVGEVSVPALRAYLAALGNPRRPRVMATPRTIAQLRHKIASQTWARKMWQDTEKNADAYAAWLLGKGPGEAEKQDIETGRRLLYVARALAFAHQVTGDENYARAAAVAIETASGWKYWVAAFHRPIIYDLGTSSCLRSFGLAYDWIADDLDQETRDKIASILWRRGLKPYLDGVRRGIWWSRSYRSNWLAVCCAGAAVGAASLLGQRPEAADIIADAYVRVCRLLDQGGRDGGWPEGVGYWGYGIGHAAVLAELLFQLSGGEINLFQHPYLRTTPFFGLYMATDRDGCVNFCDCGYGWPNSYLMLLLGVRTKNPYAVWFFRQKPSYSLDAALVYDDALPGSAPDHLPTSRHFRGIDWTVLRTGFDPDAVVVGLRGGNNGENHGHLEAGNFIISWGTARLVMDYGAARYTHEYFSRKRWQFYRANTHGNNCLLIDDLDQLPGSAAFAKTTFFHTTPDFDFVRMDLTHAYGRDASLVERAVAFVKPFAVVILDRAHTGAEHVFTWRIHPGGEASVNPAGFRIISRGRLLEGGFAGPSAVTVSTGKHQLGEPYIDAATSRTRDFRLMTVMWLSDADAAGHGLTIEPLRATGGLAVTAQHGDRRLVLAVNTDGGEMRVDAASPDLPAFVTDAQAVALVSSGAKLTRASYAGGTYLKMSRP